MRKKKASKLKQLEIRVLKPESFFCQVMLIVTQQKKTKTCGFVYEEICNATQLVGSKMVLNKKLASQDKAYNKKRHSGPVF